MFINVIDSYYHFSLVVVVYDRLVVVERALTRLLLHYYPIRFLLNIPTVFFSPQLFVID